MTDAIKDFIVQALKEDIGEGDITTLATVSSSNKGLAIFLVKEDCIIAGLSLTEFICEHVDTTLDVHFDYKDGDLIGSMSTIGYIKGNIHSILKVERLVLNSMQRMSAIATKTHHFVELVKDFGVKILDTRKTTPNFRICEKWAVSIGGGMNHRFGLYDQVLIKDNHIKANGGIQKAIENCMQYLQKQGLKVPVVVEVKNLAEFNIAKEYEIIDRILLDNFNPDNILDILKHNTNKKLIEVSGGINERNILDYAKTGIDYISIGDLTHHVNAIDISLKIV